jgi:hypothetical protein
MGQILYTLFGHEGPSTTAELSPLGDFLLTGGNDQNIVVWNTNLNETVTEELYGIQATRIDTDIYITDKAEIKRLPEDVPKPTKKESKVATGTKVNQGATSGKKDDEVPEVEPCVLGNKETKGPTYRMLKPEVKQCLDKLIYQLDLCRNTVGLLEQRISSNENRLHEIVDYIKNEDISYVSITLIVYMFCRDL